MGYAGENERVVRSQLWGCWLPRVEGGVSSGGAGYPGWKGTAAELESILPETDCGGVGKNEEIQGSTSQVLTRGTHHVRAIQTLQHLRGRSCSTI